jgi:quercetin 2,3-dioxygenase
MGNATTYRPREETTMTGKVREVAAVVAAVAATDGAGVKLWRSIGTPGLDNVDPFLMLDAFQTDHAADYIAGFPDHPHRGFETVTYMVEGRMRHHDNQGNSGLLRSGGAQWMTAGRGIVHSEMPEQVEGAMSGFQLWVNLPAGEKMRAPRYQDIEPEDIPEVTTASGVRIRVVAGEAAGATGPVDGIYTRPLFLDIALPAGATHDQPVTRGHSAFAYVFEGAAVIAARRVKSRELGVLGDGDIVTLGGGDGGGRLILVAGTPLNEPIARYGPFVMNTREEILQAVNDYQEGRF